MSVMEEIIRFRESRGISQLAFSKMIGVTATCVAQHERGIALNHIKYIEKINKVFKTEFSPVKTCFLCRRDHAGEGKLCPECRGKEERKAAAKQMHGTLGQVALAAERSGQTYGNFVAGSKVLLLSVRAGCVKGKYKTPAPEYLELGKVVVISGIK